MKRNKLLILTVIFGLVFFTGCFNSNEENKDALKFKEEYEKMNGKEASSGKVYRSITISDENVFEQVTPEDIIKKIENKETFYVYYGSKLCPWCRSSLATADKISRENGIEKIYYVDIWDDERNEIFRDKYELDENGKPVLSIEGTAAYKKTLEYFAEYLKDYNLTDSNGNVVSTGEKRIFAPNYFYVLKGKPIRMVTGTSSLQSDAYVELTDEIIKEQEEIFNNFFVNSCGKDFC